MAIFCKLIWIFPFSTAYIVYVQEMGPEPNYIEFFRTNLE